jgi:hypothetical protein
MLALRRSKPVSITKSHPQHCSANMAHAVSPGYVFPKTAAPTTQYTFGKQLGQPGQFGVAKLVTHNQTGKQARTLSLSD